MDRLATLATTAVVDKVAKVAMNSIQGSSKKARRRAKKAEKKKAKKEVKVVEKAAKKKRKGMTETTTQVPVRQAITIRPNSIKATLGKFRGKDSMRMTGSDFWGVIQTQSGGIYVDLFNMPVNPMAVLNTRVQVEATLWQKFHYHRLEVEFVPSVGTSVNGAGLLTHVDDPEVPIPGGQGSLSYVTALMGVDDAKVVPWYSKGRHMFRGDDDPTREFYIQPDQENEARLTTQGMLKVIQMTMDNPGPTGFIYVHYDVSLYDKILTVNESASAVPLYCTKGASSSAEPITINDSGFTVALTLAVDTSASTKIATSTLYAVYFNFEIGGASAMQIYYWKSPATFNGATFTALYTAAIDASSGGGENKVRGSYIAGAIPTNATMFVIPTANLVDPQLKQKSPSMEYARLLAGLEDKIAKLSIAMEDMQHNSSLAKLISSYATVK